MRRPLSLLSGALLLALTACGGSSTPAAAPTPSAAPVSPIAEPTCPPPATKAYRWPAQIPQELPTLPGATIQSKKQTTEGLYVVQFSTATSLREGVLFIVRRLPAAGFTLGRGDAEPTEADAPFTKGDLRGVLRGAAVTACQTTWVLAVTRKVYGGTGSPLLPAHTGPSPSPLPFG